MFRSHRLALPVPFLAVTLLAGAAPARNTAQAPDTARVDSVVVVRKPTIPIAPFFIDGVDDTLFTATLEVPENRDAPGGRKIPLHIVIVPASEKGEKGRKPSPLFHIAGGPGVAATERALAYATELAMHRQHRDVVLVDQRGTGRSNPLHCPELEQASRLDHLYDPAAVTRCRDELAKKADLSRYRTIDAVRDLEDVRNALAYDAIDLMGVSYGTRVVQAYMREYPGNVRAAVMIATIPLAEKVPLHHARNAEEVLQRILDDCDADPDCGRAFPSLRREWGELLDALDAGPVIAQYMDATGMRVVPVHRGPFCEALCAFMDTTPTQRLVPYLIHRAAAGDFRPFLNLVSSPREAVAGGVYLCVTCPEGTTRILPGEVDSAVGRAFPGRYRVEREVAACSIWGLSAAPEDGFRPLTSTIPTLLLAGAMDAVAPVAWAQDVSSRLTNSLVVVVDHLGHIPRGLANMECYDAIIADFFLRGSAAGLDTSCLETMMPPDFTAE